MVVRVGGFDHEVSTTVYAVGGFDPGLRREVSTTVYAVGGFDHGLRRVRRLSRLPVYYCMCLSLFLWSRCYCVRVWLVPRVSLLFVFRW